MTIQNTPIYALPYPQAADPADAPTQLAALCARIEAVLGPIDTQAKAKDTTVGLLAARPVFGTAGRHYFATDTVAEYVDTGTAWLRIGVAAGVVASILAASAPAGWRSCDGSAITNSGATADLYAAIGAALPDLRGRTVVGTGPLNVPAVGDPARAVAAKGGVTAVTLTGSQSGVQAHAHNTTAFVTGSAINGSPSSTPHPNSWGLATNVQFVNPANEYAVTTGVASNAAAVNATAEHDNMTPFQVLSWVVKL